MKNKKGMILTTCAAITGGGEKTRRVAEKVPSPPGSGPVTDQWDDNDDKPAQSRK